jgi:hypothetical protein
MSLPGQLTGVASLRSGGAHGMPIRPTDPTPERAGAGIGVLRRTDQVLRIAGITWRVGSSGLENLPTRFAVCGPPSERVSLLTGGDQIPPASW